MIQLFRICSDFVFMFLKYMDVRLGVRNQNGNGLMNKI